MPRTFAKPSLIAFNGSRVSDHNRDPVGINVERIATDHRMADGTKRRFFIADKRTFSISWSDLPHNAQHTVDGFWGGQEIENFYYASPGAFTLQVANEVGRVETYTVMFTSFSKNINKRGLYDFWDIDIELEQV